MLDLITNLGIVLIITWMFVYTTSFAVFTLKEKNRLGGIVVFFLTLFAALLPIYTLYIK